MKRFIIPLLLLVVTFTKAQEKLEFIDVDELISKSAETAKKKDFAATLAYLDKIPKNDSLYCSVLSNKSYYLLQQEAYKKVIQLADAGIALKCTASEDVFYINKAVALLRSDEYEAALTTIEEGLIIFPYNTSLWYNKAIALEKMDRIEEAVAAYQHTIKIDPLSQDAHLQLGNLCYKQEKLAQAMMCFNMYLLLSDAISDSFETLNSLNAVVSQTNSNTKDASVIISIDDNTFNEIDLILSQKVALNKQYNTGNKINIALVNQNHALFTWLKDYKGKGGFWSEKYVPFYQWIMKNNHFNAHTYYITQSIENESFKRIVKKNEKEAFEFAGQAIETWKDLLSKNKKDYFYNGSYVQAVGEKKGEKMTGPFEFYDPDGKLVVLASFDNKGERTGIWKWFYNNGQLKESLTYSDGKKEGENALFYENGKKYIESNFKNDAFDGVYKQYTKEGALVEKKYFKNGKVDGPYESYFAVGESIKEYDVTYVESEVEGTVIQYHANGETYASTPFTKSKRNGIEKNTTQITSYSQKLVIKTMS